MMNEPEASLLSDAIGDPLVPCAPCDGTGETYGVINNTPYEGWGRCQACCGDGDQYLFDVVREHNLSLRDAVALCVEHGLLDVDEADALLDRADDMFKDVDPTDLRVGDHILDSDGEIDVVERMSTSGGEQYVHLKYGGLMTWRMTPGRVTDPVKCHGTATRLTSEGPDRCQHCGGETFDLEGEDVVCDYCATRQKGVAA